jgi:hypothetical protein
MKRPPLALMGVAFAFATSFSLRGQVTVPAVPAGTVSLSASNIRTLGTFSDAQLGEWLDVLAATPTMAAEDLPRGGMGVNFYSLAHPNWPPLPADIRQIPVWNLSSDSGAGFYLLDDLDYPDAPLPSGSGGGGGTNGGGGFSSNLQPQVFTTNDLWLQIAGTTNTGTALTAQLVIHTPWNVTNGVYGLYFKTNLAVPYNWTWLLRNVSGQTNLIVTNLPPTQGFFMLGSPTAIRPGFTNNILADTDHGSDDGSTDLVPIGFAVNFFGRSYSNLYVNNNGNVTFNDALHTWTPQSLVDLGKNIIASFWADVDTRSTNSGVVTYGIGTVDGRAAFGVSWIDVGYYSEKNNRLNSFQLVLIARSDRASGDYDVEFNYAQIRWEAGDVSGGSDGLWAGGEITSDHCPARAGYASSGGSTFEMNGSAVPGALLDANLTTGLIYHDFNSTVPGRYVFQFHNGVPLGTP